MNSRPIDSQRLTLIGITILAALGFALVMFITTQGIGVSPDSVTYIRGARGLVEGRGFTTLSDGGNAVAITHFPPLYSFLLASLSRIGMSFLQAARWLNAFIFSATVWLVGFSVRRLVPKSLLAPIFGAFLTLTSTAMLSIHTMAWTEPTFIVLMLLSFLGLASYLERGHNLLLIFSALAVGLALLTRYAAVALIPVGVVGIIAFKSSSWQRKLSASSAFALVSMLPVVVWMIRNMLTAGNLTNREFVFHPITRSHLVQAAVTLSSWLLPEAIPVRVRLVIYLLLTICVLIISVSYAIKGRALVRRNTDGYVLPQLVVSVSYAIKGRALVRRNTDGYVLPQLLIIFIATYLAFLTASISFVDAQTPLDNRILSPVYVATVIVVLSVDPRDFLLVMRRRTGYIGLVGVGLLYALLVSFQATNWTLHYLDEGRGYTSRTWQESETISVLRQLPTGTPIYTNAPDAVYILADRPAFIVPRHTRLTTGQDNPDYQEELIMMANELREANGVLVYFDNTSRHFPTVEELEAELPLTAVLQTDDGIIYKVAVPE